MTKPVTLDRLAAVLGGCRPIQERTDRDPPAGASDGAIDRTVLHQLRLDLGPGVTQVIATYLESTPGILAELRDAASRADADHGISWYATSLSIGVRMAPMPSAAAMAAKGGVRYWMSTGP